MSIALLYERSENDENGIKLTAQQLGIDLTFLPFRKIALSISEKMALTRKPKAKTTQAQSTISLSCLTVHKAKTAVSKPHTSWSNLAKKQ